MRKTLWLSALVLALAACSQPAQPDVDTEAAPTTNTFRAYPTTSNGLTAFNWNVFDRDQDPLRCGVDYENDGQGAQSYELANANLVNVDAVFDDPLNYPQGCFNWNIGLALMNPGTYTARLYVTDTPQAPPPNNLPSTVQRTVSYSVRNQAPAIPFFYANPENAFGYNTTNLFFRALDPNDPDSSELVCDLDADGNGVYEQLDIGCDQTAGYAVSYNRLSIFNARVRARDADGGVTTATIKIANASTASALSTNLAPNILFFDAFEVDANPIAYLQEEGPLEVEFQWTIVQPAFPTPTPPGPTFETDTLTCSIDPEGDGVFNYTIPNCALEGNRTHTYPTRGLYFPRLRVSDGKGSIVEAPLWDGDAGIMQGLSDTDICGAPAGNIPLYCQGGVNNNSNGVVPASNIPRTPGLGPVEFGGGILVFNTLPTLTNFRTSPSTLAGPILIPNLPYRITFTHTVSDPDGDAVACELYIPSLLLEGPVARFGLCSNTGVTTTRTSSYNFPYPGAFNAGATSNAFRAFDGLDELALIDTFGNTTPPILQGEALVLLPDISVGNVLP